MVVDVFLFPCSLESDPTKKKPERKWVFKKKKCHDDGNIEIMERLSFTNVPRVARVLAEGLFWDTLPYTSS